MTHAPARRRRPPRNETDRWLLAAVLGFVGEELGGILLRGATDLANHENRLGFPVGQKHFQDRDEIGAFDWVAADADGGGLAQTFLRRLEHGLVGERAGARHDADLATL